MALPHVIFTDPQVANVGLSERQAREQGFKVRTSVLHLKDVPWALASRDTWGLIKLVAEEGTGRLLGAHVLADAAGEVIQEATLAICFGLSINDLVETFHPYLTMVEGLKLAALTFERDVSKLSCLCHLGPIQNPSGAFPEAPVPAVRGPGGKRGSQLSQALGAGAMTPKG